MKLQISEMIRSLWCLWDTVQVMTTWNNFLFAINFPKKLQKKYLRKYIPFFKNISFHGLTVFLLCRWCSVYDVGLPTFCFAIPGHLNTGASNLFKPRAILAHQKYWQAKQMKHLNFCPKLIVISQKKKVLT